MNDKLTITLDGVEHSLDAFSDEVKSRVVMLQELEGQRNKANMELAKIDALGAVVKGNLTELVKKELEAVQGPQDVDAKELKAD